MDYQDPEYDDSSYDPYTDENYDPYHDPANFAPLPPGGLEEVTPPDYSYVDPNTGRTINTGGPQAGWDYTPDHGWVYTDPRVAGPSATGEGNPNNRPGMRYGGPSRPNYDFFRNAPSFDFSPPSPFAFDPFAAPSMDEARAEPGYEFARGEGQRALEQSAAGRGVLRTGGSLKDLIGWGNRFAEQNYGNVFNRKFQGWNANRNNAFENYNMNYNNAFDLAQARYAPQYSSWQREMELSQRAADDEFNRAWESYQYDNPSAKDILDAGSR